MGRGDFGVAFGIPEPWTSELQEWRERLGDPRAARIPPHVTLLPPTSLAAEKLSDIEEHLRVVAAAEHPFLMRLRGTQSFRPVSPVVFVPLVQGILDAERIQAKVRSGLLHRELDFPFHPHVTVAHDLPNPALDEALSALATFDASFTVWGFTLFEQDPYGVWRPQRDFPFGAVGLPGPVEPEGHR